MTRFVFVLLDDFSALSVTSAIETLRIAGDLGALPELTWALVSESGAPVRSSQGVTFQVDGPLPALAQDETAVICGGERIAAASTPRVIAWLRRQAAFGAHIGGLCTAAHTLAAAGLLSRRRATIHYSEAGAFAERFPDVPLTDRPFEVDGPVFTTAGGVASIDTFLALIGQISGPAIAARVTERLMYAQIHDVQATARITRSARQRLRDPRLARAVERIEETAENPVGPADLATELGLSTRQVERLFMQHLGMTPTAYSAQLRLERARDLLVKTAMPVTEIGIACGFGSASYFSRRFRQAFGMTPQSARKAAIPR